MGKHLVLVGGGHAHLTALLHCGSIVEKGHRVTLVSSSAYHYYSGMGPGMLSGIYTPGEVRFHIGKMAMDRGAEFIEDKAIRVKPGNRILYLASGKEIRYDVVSFNTGSNIPVDSIRINGGEVYTVKPIVNLLRARRRILSLPGDKACNITVAGGGPAGVELAGNLLRLLKDSGKNGRLTLVAGTRILKGFHERVRTLARISLSSRGAHILEGARVTEILKEGVTLDDGTGLPADMVFVASGVRPSPLFKDSGIPSSENGGLLVNPHLQSVAHPEIFGGGDCISLEGNPLDKVGVYAVRENPVLFHNIQAALEGGSLMRFDPGGSYLLVFNMGDGTGVLWKKWLVLDGRLAFIIKDYIDRRFMRKFQVSGEREEAEIQEEIT